MPIGEAPPIPPPVPVTLALTAERATVADGVAMGMVGLHYLRPWTSSLSVGVSVFGATTGDRGGFFGWGLSSAYRWRTDAWAAEAGLFVGGGGGSPGWVGGGLMLRPHLALTRELGPLRLGLGVSQLWFPSGSVRSTQPFLSLGWSADALAGPPAGGPAPEAAGWPLQARRVEVSVQLSRHDLRGGPARRDGSGDGAPLRTGGVALRRGLGDAGDTLQPYALLSMAGALSAGYAGYAELLGGLGVAWALPVQPALTLRVEAALGSGGAGAALDTGGGLLRRVDAGIAWQGGRSWRLAALAGRTASKGPFQANDVRLELSWLGWDALPGAATATPPPDGPWRWQGWAAAAGWSHAARMRRDDGRDPGLGVATLKLERELGAGWRATGQASIATDGDAGGYASGQLGLGWLTPAQADSRWRYGAEASLGTAGGGGVRVGGGIVGQVLGQARLRLAPALALQLDAGWLRSRSGELSTPLVGLSVVVPFSRLSAP